MLNNLRVKFDNVSSTGYKMRAKVKHPQNVIFIHGNAVAGAKLPYDIKIPFLVMKHKAVGMDM